MATIWLNPNCSAQIEWEVRQEAQRDGDTVMPPRPFPWNRAAYRAIEKAHRAQPVLERTSAGRQAVIPGAAADLAGLAKKRAGEPLRPRVPQAACDVGLFGDTAAQLDLVDACRRLARQA
jgi:hypothetical protein